MKSNGISRKRMQLFCIPFAGGSKSAFKELACKINCDIDVVLIEYPGHDSRIKEPFCKTIQELKEDVKRQIEASRDKNVPYSILGYSMGSIVTYELLSDIWNADEVVDAPVHAFLCANESLLNYRPKVNFSKMSEDEVREKLVSMGGIDERILSSPRFLRIFLRPVEADYGLLEKYCFEVKANNPKVDCTIFYAEQDTAYEQVASWTRLFNGNVDFYMFGNNHFFIYDSCQKMANVINKKLLNEE